MKASISQKKAPEFSLPDQNGVMYSLTKYKGKWLVVYFYPKDNTPGCTKEACGFRDAAVEYKKKGIEVIGISKDSVSSHKTFAEKYHLSFTLLSDVSKEVIKAYGAWGEKKFMGRVFNGVLRKSFLIGPDQTIRKEYQKVDVFIHAKEILEDVVSLSS
jgi:peroxiredoxin Q/BCP